MYTKEMLYVNTYKINEHNAVVWKEFTFQFTDIKDVLACIEVLKTCKTYDGYVVSDFEYKQKVILD